MFTDLNLIYGSISFKQNKTKHHIPNNVFDLFFRQLELFANVWRYWAEHCDSHSARAQSILHFLSGKIQQINWLAIFKLTIREVRALNEWKTVCRCSFIRNIAHTNKHHAFSIRLLCCRNTHTSAGLLAFLFYFVVYLLLSFKAADSKWARLKERDSWGEIAHVHTTHKIPVDYY